jgi:hypothetical protein
MYPTNNFLSCQKPGQFSVNNAQCFGAVRSKLDKP